MNAFSLFAAQPAGVHWKSDDGTPFSTLVRRALGAKIRLCTAC